MSSPEMKLSDPTIAGNGERISGSLEFPIRLDESTTENDVRYGIADCRKRVRTQRTTLRTPIPPTESPTGERAASICEVASYAEILATVSMNQSSLSRLVECLLDNHSSRNDSKEKYEERGAALT